jgi:dolichol-phosphate mannosyltransferase
LKYAPASVSIVLPAWNEASALPRAVREADQALRTVTSHYEIIVVDDGSVDGTAECLESLKQEYRSLRVLRHENNQGYGAALRTGFAAARCDLVVFTDADVQFDLREIDRFVFLAREYDIVCGYRIDRQDTALRCFYSRVYNGLVRTLVGTKVRDIDCAFKMFRREKLQRLEVTTDGFLVNTELLTQAGQHGYSVVEVGVTHRPRCEGQSTVSIRHIPVVLTSLLRFWWNNVQFPGRVSAETGPASPKADRSNQHLLWLQGLLLIVAAVLLMPGLSYPLIDRDETRYAEIPREMVVTGDWLVPQLNFKAYYDKPPLLYWACAASYSIFGVSEWSARLIPALSGLLTLATTIYFGSRLFNRRVGLLAGVVLLLSAGFLGVSRILLIDGLLTACVTLSLFAACEAVRKTKLQIVWWLLAAAAVGLGFLSKGPIALVLFLPPIVAYAWLTECAYQARLRDWLLFGCIATLIAGPWFIAVTQQVPDFAYQFFYRHHVERFGGAFHAKPIWFFLPVLLVGGHPWSFLALPCLKYVSSRCKSIRDQRTPELGFMLLWAAWCLAFFTVSRCKLPPYILPAAPALALVVGKLLEDLLWEREGIQWGEYTMLGAPRLATATSLIAAIGLASFGARSGFESTSTVVLLAACGVILMSLMVSFHRYLQHPAASWSVCLATTLVTAALVLHREIPHYALAHTLMGPTSPIRKQFASAGDIPVVTVGHEWSEVPFYLNRSDIAQFDNLQSVNFIRQEARAGKVLLIARTSDGKRDRLPTLPPHIRIISTADRGRARLMLLELMPQQELTARPVGYDAQR